MFWLISDWNLIREEQVENNYMVEVHTFFYLNFNSHYLSKIVIFQTGLTRSDCMFIFGASAQSSILAISFFLLRYQTDVGAKIQRGKV